MRAYLILFVTYANSKDVINTAYIDDNYPVSRKSLISKHITYISY